MDKIIRKYDKRGNKIYHEDSICKIYYEYDKNNNLIHYKNINNFEFWKEFDENNNEIHYKSSSGYEEFYKYNNRRIRISKSEFEQIKRIKELNEFLKSNKKINRFKLMDI